MNLEHDPQSLDVVLLDSYSLLFRAFHAFPLSLTAPDGRLTNAVFGFTKLLLDVLAQVQPKYLIAAIDMGKPTFRHEQFVDYKANREEAPNELKQQIKDMLAVLDVLEIPTLGFEGYEADDVIGTLATKLRADQADLKVGIFTSDRDSFQLVGGSVFALFPATKQHQGLQLIGVEEVIDRFGVRPDQVVDYKALCGDASDNIPGVRGIGPKSAQKLLATFDTLERLYTAIALTAGKESFLDIQLTEAEKAELKELGSSLGATTLQKLSESIENAFLSQKLAQIDRDVPLTFSLDQAQVSSYDKEKTIELFTTLGFRSLLKHLPADAVEKGIQESLF
jgi:DNA polymerase-1